MSFSLAAHGQARHSAGATRLRASVLVAASSLALLTLSACTHAPAQVGAPAASVARPIDTTGAIVYSVDPAESEVDILVFRGGTLARLGHNHVMAAKHLAGRAWIHPQFEKSGFDISLQVADLIVDDPDARRAAGSDFPPEIPQSDKDATRTNMLKSEVLDAERFPEVRVQATSVRGNEQRAEVTVGIAIKDVRREVTVPVALSVDSSRLVAQGEFDILQSDFGIKPFSVGFGALQVQDRLHVRFRIVATR